MKELKPLICPRCGGTVNRAKMVCEYCGTPFDDGTMYINLTAYPAHAEILQGRIMVSRDLLDAMHRVNPQQWEQDVMEHLSRKMAEKLIPFIEMETQHHPEWNSMEIRGKLRVLPPDYRF